MFSQACVKNSVHTVCVWQGRHAWQEGVRVWQGACMARGHAWQGGRMWQGACMAGVCMTGDVHGGGRGHVCVAGEMVTAATVHILLECISPLNMFEPVCRQ